MKNTRYRLRNKQTGKESQEFPSLTALVLSVQYRAQWNSPPSGVAAVNDENDWEIVEYQMTPVGTQSLKEYMDGVRERKEARDRRVGL
jgi:hypothetical protein